MSEVRKMLLLPPRPDACQVCAAKHGPSEPHNPDSLYWQTSRQMEGGPRPTWTEALAHCPDDVFDAWQTALAERGVIVPSRGEDPTP